MTVKECYLMTTENYNIYTAYTVLKNYLQTKPKELYSDMHLRGGW